MMKHRIIFATGNAGKMKEIRLILEDLGCPVLSMKEAQADPEIVEKLCRAMVIHMGPPTKMEKCEVVLIGEPLGY